MLILDYDLIMQDCYKISDDLLFTIKTYLEFEIPLYMDMFGRVYLNDDISIATYIGTIDILY